MKKSLEFILLPIFTMAITCLAKICIKPLEKRDIEKLEE